MSVLETHGLTKEFSGFRAVDGVDLRVEEGSVHALVGPNGAGKTTLFKMLTGFLKPTAGQVTIFGEDVSQLSPVRIARKGVARGGRTVVLVEHNMRVVSELADVVTVLQYGKVLAEGPYQTAPQNPQVIGAYLGEADV
jgi:ABC-type branched-subunit amino acid transport system ATPase component